MKLFGSSSTLLLMLIIGLVWSEQLEEQDSDTNDLETAESAFHIDPKTGMWCRKGKNETGT